MIGDKGIRAFLGSTEISLALSGGIYAHEGSRGVGCWAGLKPDKEFDEGKTLGVSIYASHSELNRFSEGK